MKILTILHFQSGGLHGKQEDWKRNKKRNKINTQTNKWY